jgi:hypothetical protein
MFRDPAGPSSGRIVWIHYGCVYTVECECAVGIMHCPRPGYTQTFTNKDYIYFSASVGVYYFVRSSVSKPVLSPVRLFT